MSLQAKTAFITGASRGIGKAIALRLAKEGMNIVVAAKSIAEDNRLGGTIYSAAKEIENAGGKAFPVKCDIRSEEDITMAVQLAKDAFGGIDVLINNASAIYLNNTISTEAKRFDLIHDINVRGTFLVTKACIPHLEKSTNPHIITLSPPLNMEMKWWKNHPAYTLSKYSMTMLALAWSEELKGQAIASNALWPATTIDTAAVRNLLGGEALAKMSRKPEIVADAVFHIISQPSSGCTGNTFIDEIVLQQAGITNLDSYAVDAGSKLYPDLFL